MVHVNGRVVRWLSGSAAITPQPGVRLSPRTMRNMMNRLIADVDLRAAVLARGDKCQFWVGETKDAIDQLSTEHPHDQHDGSWTAN